MNKQENIPALRFPEFTGNWVAKKLEDVAIKINSGKTPLGGDNVYTDSGVLFIRSQNVLDDVLSFDNSTFISEEINDTMKNSVVCPNDILLNITGGSLGRSCVVPEDFNIGNVNQHVCIIRLDNSTSPKFVQPIFSSSKGQNIFISLQTGSGREGLNFQSIKGIKLSFPSLPEQQKIATFLSSVDEKLQGLKKKKSLLEAYKKGMMQRLFSSEPGLTRLEDEQDLDDNNPTILTSRKLRFRQDNGEDFPEWEEKTLGEVSENVMYGMNSSAIPFDGHNKYLRITDIDDNSRTFKPNPLTSPDGEIEDKYKLKDGDIVFTRTGASVGKSYLYNYKDGNLLFAGFLIKFSIRNNNPYFIFSQTLLNSYNKWVQLMSMRSGQPGINAEEYKSFTLQIPSLPEQTKIANFLSAIDEKIAKVSQEIEQVTVWKKGLLQQIFV